jgi:hypothetical protein
MFTAKASDGVVSTIKNCIVPLVNLLRTEMPMKFRTMFSSDLRDQYGIGTEVECHNIEDSDIFFNAIKQK